MICLTELLPTWVYPSAKIQETDPVRLVDSPLNRMSPAAGRTPPKSVSCNVSSLVPPAEYRGVLFGVMLEPNAPIACVKNLYPLALGYLIGVISNTADLTLFLLRVMSPAVGGTNAVLSSLSSCSITPRSFSVLLTIERIIKESLTCLKSPSCTAMITGDSNVFGRDPSPPTTVIFWLNVTGVSKVVTRPPITSSSSPSSARTAASINVSSPVIALILLLPM